MMTCGRLLYFIIIGILSVLRVTKAAAPDLHGDLNRIEVNQISSNITFENFFYDEDIYLVPMELIKKYGYQGENHHVMTKDGYILEMHRITGPNSNSNPTGKPIVFLMHGLMSSSVDWIITGPEKGLGYILADHGYDVWMGNARGNEFSRRHRMFSVSSKAYWQFSWHEIGVYDVPAMIDYALNKSNRTSLYYVGHSQGTTVFWVMTSIKPQYNSKIDAMFALAPIAYVAHMTSPLFRALVHFDIFISGTMEMLGTYEFRPTEKFMKEVKGVACDPHVWSQPICENLLLIMAGMGSDQLNKTQLPVILGHVPAGSSVKQFLHYAQLMKSDTFRQYDFGFFGNLKKYHRLTPPPYDLSRVTAPVILYYSINDYMAHVKDVNRLTMQLPNVYARLRVPHDKFSHFDYVWGSDAKTLVYNKIISFMVDIRTRN